MALLRPRQSFASSGEPFTVYIPEDGDTSGLDSVISSLSSQYGGILGATTTAAGQATSTLAPGGSLTTGTTLATSISNGSFMTSRTGSSIPSSMHSATSSRTTTAAVVSGSAGAGMNGLPARNTCTSPSCSSGLQAAIAIGILVAVFIIASVVVLDRRNKKAAAATRSAAPIRAQALEESAALGSSGGIQSQTPGMSEINSGTQSTRSPSEPTWSPFPVTNAGVSHSKEPLNASEAVQNPFEAPSDEVGPIAAHHRTTVNRNKSHRSATNVSSMAETDAPSVHEAHEARNATVNSAGRAIDDVRSSGSTHRASQ